MWSKKQSREAACCTNEPVPEWRAAVPPGWRGLQPAAGHLRPGWLKWRTTSGDSECQSSCVPPSACQSPRCSANEETGCVLICWFISSTFSTCYCRRCFQRWCRQPKQPRCRAWQSTQTLTTDYWKSAPCPCPRWQRVSPLHLSTLGWSSACTLRKGGGNCFG